VQEIKWCREIVENERAKQRIAQDLPEQDEQTEAIKPTVHAQLYCVECGVIATCYCPECQDCLCEECFERIHAKGNRREHVPSYLIPCSLCQVFPAKLQCTYSFGTFCHECYARKHVKTLPKFLDLKPVKIDYTLPNPTSFKKTNNTKSSSAAVTKAHAPPDAETQLGPNWHAFYDLRGIKYFYNFETQESLRRPGDEMMVEDVEEDPNSQRALTLQALAQNKMAKRLQFYSTKATDEQMKKLAKARKSGDTTLVRKSTDTSRAR
jgi:hypothetical protein